MRTTVEANPELSLTPPAPVSSTTGPSAPFLMLDAETTTRLDTAVDAYVGALLQTDPRSDAFKKKVDGIHALGNQEIRQSANVSNRMLERPVGALSRTLGQSSTVSVALLQLRRTVEDLDPSHRGLLDRRKILGVVPFGNRLRDYFGKYESAQGHLNAIVQALYRGQDELLKDNAAIEQEKVNLWDIMDRLKQYLYLARKMDAALEARIVEIEARDPERAKTLREDCVFYVRQKTQDLATQLAVSAQGYLALDLVRKNNVELVKGVDRATTTTISALRTAVMVAQALVNQKLVLDQIGALNATTADMIDGTSTMLRQQSASVHEQAAGATVSIEKLRHAFANIYATIDTIDAYKLQALDSMRQTVDALSKEVARAQAYLERAHLAPTTELGGLPDELRIPARTA
ncbi:MAG TPA: toxic anion resistance protein [Candidatus Dormibacteraeota bacterium]|jgi:uncharacterized protein YaaN involved in tellurite resistance